MSNEEIHTEPQWAELPGKVLEGGYELEDLLEADEDRAKFKLRVLGDRTVDAFVQLERAAARGAEERLAVWESLRKISHPNLSTPLASGKAELEGAELIYATWRKPDETLSGALRERALTPKEAGEVLLSVSRGLERLLGDGLLHGCVSPEQIVSSGDAVQLTTVCARRVEAAATEEGGKPKYLAPESTGANTTPAADVWCLGATLFEALTQRACGPDCGTKAATLPAPFGTIVPRCLASDPPARCKLSEAVALYKTAPTAVPKAAQLAPPVAHRVRVPERRPTARVRQREAERSLTPWVVGLIVAIAILLVVWGLSAGHPKPRNPPAAQNTPATAPVATPKADKAWETRTLPAETSASKAQPPAQPVTPPAHETPAGKREPNYLKGDVWRVVLFTYNRAQDAEARAKVINERRPEIHAQVFSPNGQTGPYLVIAGSGLSREDAVKLRRKALSLGMPHDSYIQNYNR